MSLQIKRILFATDFSMCAQHAEAYAAFFAQRYEAALDIVHVLEVYPGLDPEFPVNTLYIEQLRKEADTRIEEIVSRFRQRKLAVVDHRAVGMPSVEICSMAVKNGADLILLGTHGRSGLEHILLGSTAERVITMAPCPVLTIRLSESSLPDHASIKVANILVPIDFSDCSLDALAYGVQIAKQFLASLKILHVVEPASYGIDFTTGDTAERDRMRTQVHAHLETLSAAIRATGLSVDPVQRGGLPSESILQTARESTSDLIVMGTHGRRGISHILKGSVAETVLRRGSCPVLTVKSQKFARGQGRTFEQTVDSLSAI